MAARTLSAHPPAARGPELFHHVGHAAKGRQQLISLVPQSIIVLIDARNDRLKLVDPPELGAKALIVLGQVLDLLVQHPEELTAFIEPASDILPLRVHGHVLSTGTKAMAGG